MILSLLLCVSVAGPVMSSDRSDTRVLIDISGSMKQNDPNNLRGSALRLLVGLLPRGNRAGVWTFGQYSNMLIPLGEVNDSWKKRAKLFSEKISSPGQFTNIEEVLREASSDWGDAAKDFSRNLILLTDGMVDVSKSDAKNQASRQRILEQLAPKIKANGGIIHTIALSDRADHALMKELAAMTGGWYEQVNSADELQRVFLRMFEKVGKPDSVPLTGNSFSLDKSISEATVLVFSKPGSPPARLLSPSGKQYDANSLPANISWHRDQGYELVTISSPETGQWTIEADMDPDNRVMVVTDLKMLTSTIPNRIAIGEAVPVSVYFTENDKPVSKPEFLEIVNVTATQSFAGNQTEPAPLADDGIPPDSEAADGRFTAVLGNQSVAGTLELTLSADGRSFVRESRQSTEVVVPASLSFPEAMVPSEISLKLMLDSQVVDAGSVVIDAWMEDMNGQRTDISFAKAEEGMTASIDKTAVVGRQLGYVNVNGKTLSGNDFVYQPEEFSIDGMKEAEPEPVKAPEPVVEKTAEPVAEQPVAVEQQPAAGTEPVVDEPAPEPEPEEETDWLITGLMIGGGNLLLVGLGVGIWWFVKKRSADDDLMLLDENQLEAEQTEEDQEPESEKPAVPEPPAAKDEAAAGASVDASAGGEDNDLDDVVITGADEVEELLNAAVEDEDRK